MRVKAATVQKVLLGSALVAALAWNLAQASEINGLALSNGATGTRAEIALDQEAEFKVISLQGPDRLVVDLPTSRLASNVRLPAPTGLIKAVRTGQPSPGTTRIVFDLAQPVAVLKPHLEPGATGPRLVLEWPGDGAEVASAPVRLASTPAPQDPASTPAAASPANPDADAAASAAATSRLISEIAARTMGSPSTVPANGPAPAGNVAPSSGTTTPSSTTATTTAAGNAPVKVAGPSSIPAPPAMSATAPATTIATGIPTRIATGQPATPPSAMPSGNPGVPGAIGGSTQPASPAGAVKTIKDVRGSGMRPLVIAIDAGHGGQDSGAVGPNGNKEKDVTLAIARELARQVNATPGLKAYLTRDSDFYIPLNNRAK
ncbi:MAG TPA: N-acetylmuramoyl-L-alanine amidase, partial [Lysobacter sp.]